MIVGLISEKNVEKGVPANTQFKGHGIKVLASTHHLHLKVECQVADLKVNGPIFYMLFSWEIQTLKI